MIIIWWLVYVCVTLCLSGAVVLWLFPKKWIMWSETAASLIPRGSPPRWRSLNALGKIGWILLHVGGFGLVAVLLIGTLIERA